MPLWFFQVSISLIYVPKMGHPAKREYSFLEFAEQIVKSDNRQRQLDLTDVVIRMPIKRVEKDQYPAR
jgi:hypothetical protein